MSKDVREIELAPKRTYKTRGRAKTEALKCIQDRPIRFMIVKNDSDRYSPVFVGEEAMYAGLFHKFPIIG